MKNTLLYKLFSRTNNVTYGNIDEIEEYKGNHKLVNTYTDTRVSIILFQNIPVVTIDDVANLLNTTVDNVYNTYSLMLAKNMIYNGIDYFIIKYIDPYDKSYKYYDSTINASCSICNFGSDKCKTVKSNKFESNNKIVFTDSGLAKMIPFIQSDDQALLNRAFELSGNKDVIDRYSNPARNEQRYSNNRNEVMAYKCK